MVYVNYDLFFLIGAANLFIGANLLALLLEIMVIFVTQKAELRLLK